MPTCLSCGANLAPEWKYCIYCGAVAATVSPRRRGGRDDYGLTIPPTRRRDVLARAPRTKLDIPLLVGIVLGLAGTALIVYMAILLFGPK
jgi:hypothetical protein